MSKIVTEGNLEEEDLDSSKISHSDEDYKYVKEAQKGNIAAINHIISKYDIMVKAKSKILEKLKSFGGDVLSNVLANLITNPAIWSKLI